MQNEAIVPVIQNGIPQQVFKPGSWLVTIEYINHQVLSNNLMIAVLAEPRSGKTTFVGLLQSELDSRVKSQVLTATASFSQVDFLAQLNAAYPMTIDAEINLANLVAGINERKEPLLIIIDDAQYLPDTFLQEALFEIKNQGNKGFFHLCLVADFSLAPILNKLEGDSIRTLETGNLTAIETKTYLRSVLPASKKLDKTMSEQRLTKFYELTKGNIASINAQMTPYFCPASVNSDEKYKYLLRGASFLAAAAIALVASSYLWPNRFLPSSEDFQDEYESAQSFAEISQPLPSLIPIIPEREPILISQLTEINQELLTKRSLIPSWYVATVNQVQPSPRRVVDIKIDDENDDSLVVRDRVVVIPKILTIQQIEQVAPEVIPKIPVVTSQKVVGVAKQRPLLNTKPRAQRIRNKSPQVSVKNKPFTIQLMASLSQNNLMHFVKSHKITETVKIRLTKRDGVDWYVLTIGEYKQREHAKAVLKDLPAELARFNPWIRPVAQLNALG
ncbi:MAG: SPOR domain-containing protein [Tatlockia sp.]|nr:SPOR domain-containing protein [Tatlockia sp.]